MKYPISCETPTTAYKGPKKDNMSLAITKKFKLACIGTLTADCSLKEILSTTSGSVDKMLSGEMFPQRMWALHLVEICAQSSRVSHTIMEGLEEELKKRSSESHP